MENHKRKICRNNRIPAGGEPEERISGLGDEELLYRILTGMRDQRREEFLLEWGLGGGTSQKEGSYESVSIFLGLLSACRHSGAQRFDFMSWTVIVFLNSGWWLFWPPPHILIHTHTLQGENVQSSHKEKGTNNWRNNKIDHISKE